MNDVQNSKGADKKSLPLFFNISFKVIFVIVLVSSILLYFTFTFEEVPPILNRGIQPATFPKALLIFIIGMTLIIYFLATRIPWKIEKKLPRSFFLTLFSFFLFVIISKILDFFLAISALSIFVSYYWGEKRLFYLLLATFMQLYVLSFLELFLLFLIK